jgi:hypothetical protein
MRIAEFVEDLSSPYTYAFGAIARFNTLPLFFDWSAFMALLPDGQIVWVPYDEEPGDIEVVRSHQTGGSSPSESVRQCHISWFSPRKLILPSSPYLRLGSELRRSRCEKAGTVYSLGPC